MQRSNMCWTVFKDFSFQVWNWSTVDWLCVLTNPNTNWTCLYFKTLLCKISILINSHCVFNQHECLKSIVNNLWKVFFYWTKLCIFTMIVTIAKWLLDIKKIAQTYWLYDSEVCSYIQNMIYSFCLFWVNIQGVWKRLVPFRRFNHC